MKEPRLGGLGFSAAGLDLRTDFSTNARVDMALCVDVRMPICKAGQNRRGRCCPSGLVFCSIRTAGVVTA